jgi:hypothetical protein
MLTCAIRRSGIRGLDLFLVTSSGFALLELERRQVGQRHVCLGAGSVGVDSPGADGSGAGVAVAGFDLCGAALADLIKQTQLYHHTSRTECKLTVSTSS